MNIIFYIIFILILIGTIIQLLFSFSNFYLLSIKKNMNRIFRCRSNTKKENVGDCVMLAVKRGTVKKQLLPNNSPKYDSKSALKCYIKFINESKVYDKIVSIKESAFYG